MSQSVRTAPVRCRRLLLICSSVGLAGLVTVLTTATDQAQVPGAQQREQGPAPMPPPLPVFTEEREAAALTFVRKNRPELVDMLGELKVHNVAEYEHAVSDLFRTSEMLASVKQEDPTRYELALANWRAETRTHLLAARLVRQPGATDEARTELRQAVETLVDNQIVEVAHHIRRIETELERIRDHHKNLRDHRDDLVQERMEAILKAVEQQQAPRADGSRSKP
jgi:hypothetical protein